jgi:AcrR family transcriptional regulator
MAKIRKNPEVLQVALELAEKYGYMNITRDQIAENAGVATGTVSLHLGTMSQLRRTLVRHALKEGRHRIVAQAIVAGDPRINRLSEQERRTALMAVA